MQSRKYMYPSHLPGKHWRRLLCMLIFTLTILSGIALSCPASAQAAAQIGPLITWDSTMIYPGQNGGNPWGPPGEQAFVHGQTFIPGQKLSLVLVNGNSNTNPNVCRGKATGVAQVTVATGGTFETTFIWPLALNRPGQFYSICALGTNNIVMSTQDGPGPFTVLTENPPSISLSAATVAAGGTITVNGQNWVPDQQINVDVTFPNQPGSVANVLTTSGNGLHGTFSTAVVIPTNTPAGNYSVTAFSGRSNLLSTSYTQTNQLLAITSTTTPTPTVTATPTPSVTPTPVATATTGSNQTPTATLPAVTGSGNTNGNTPGGGDNKNIVFVLLITLAVIILGIGGLLLFMLAQRKKVPAPQLLAGTPGSGIMNPYPAGQLYGAGYNQPGQQMQSSVRTCSRCGSQLPPNSFICGSCGLHSGLPFDPDEPTQAF